MSSVINMLTGVKTAEVSLVRRGANNKRFALTKSKDLTMTYEEILKQVLETPAEGEDKLVETLKSAGSDETAINVAVSNFRMQSGFKDQLSAENLAAVSKAAGFEVAKADHADDDDEDKDKFPFKGKKKKKADMNKSDEAIPAHIQKHLDEKDAELVSLRKSAEEGAARLEKIEKEAELRSYIQKCADDYSGVPGMSTDEMGEMLMNAHDVSPDFGAKLEKQWKTVSESMESSSLLLKSAGHRQESVVGGSVDKIQVIAKGLLAADPTLTQELAIAKAHKDNPKLYTEYLSENPRQTGER